MPDPCVWGSDRWDRHLLVALARHESARTYFADEARLNPCPACATSYASALDTFDGTDYVRFVLALKEMVEAKLTVASAGIWDSRVRMHLGLRKRIDTLGFDVSPRQLLLQSLLDVHIGQRMNNGTLYALRTARAVAHATRDKRFGQTLHAALDDAAARADEVDDWRRNFEFGWSVIYGAGIAHGVWDASDEGEIRSNITVKVHASMSAWLRFLQ